MLTNFLKKKFTVRLSSKFAIKSSPGLKHVATLRCEIYILKTHDGLYTTAITKKKMSKQNAVYDQQQF